MKQYRHNLAHLELIADALGELLTEVTFVGGCTTILLVDKAAFGEVRQGWLRGNQQRLTNFSHM